MRLKHIIPVVFLAALIGCKKNLEEKPESFLVETNAFNTANDANSAVNGVYNRLRSIYSMDYVYMADVSGEELEANAFLADAFNIDRNLQTSATGVFDNFYTNSYIAIDRANRVIENVPKISMATPLRDQIVGEAKFLRALLYFNLVRAFGDVPLVLNASNDISNVDVPRETVAKVYEQIVADLKAAEGVLPLKYTKSGEVGRATSGAAKSILAKVYLTLKDWNNAATKAKEVITAAQYSLFDKYKDVFPPENKNGKEHIFSVQFSCVLNSFGSPYAESFALVFTYPVQRAGGFLYVTQKHINSYLPGDIRKSTNVIFERQDGSGNGAIIKPGPDQGPVTDKWWDPTPCGRQQARNNYMVIRYADVLLMYAEALNELNGPTGEAYDAINQVRKRAREGNAAANPPDLSGLTKEQFRDAVLLERSWELCFEGHRRWDLLRTGKYISTLTAAGVPVAQKDLLFPIPANEKDVNKALTQNDGY